MPNHVLIHHIPTYEQPESGLKSPAEAPWNVRLCTSHWPDVAPSIEFETIGGQLAWITGEIKKRVALRKWDELEENRVRPSLHPSKSIWTGECACEPGCSTIPLLLITVPEDQGAWSVIPSSADTIKVSQVPSVIGQRRFQRYVGYYFW